MIFSANLKWKYQVIFTSTNKADQMLGRIKNSFAHFYCELHKSLDVGVFLYIFIASLVSDSQRRLSFDRESATKLVSLIRDLPKALLFYFKACFDCWVNSCHSVPDNTLTGSASTSLTTTRLLIKQNQID